MARRGPATGTLLPRVLLALLVALVVRGAAAPNGTRPAELGRGWDGLVARSLARLPVAAQPPQAAVRSGAGDYLLGLKRLRRLYCNVGIGFHLQVLPDGRIGGVHADTRDSECGACREGGDPGSRPRNCADSSSIRLDAKTVSAPAGRTPPPAFGSLGSRCRIPAPSPVGTHGSPGQMPRLRPDLGGLAADRTRELNACSGDPAWVFFTATTPASRSPEDLGGGSLLAQGHLRFSNLRFPLPPGLLELSPVQRGVVSIFGVASRFFVAMSSRGKLFGVVSTWGVWLGTCWGQCAGLARL